MALVLQAHLLSFQKEQNGGKNMSITCRRETERETEIDRDAERDRQRLLGLQADPVSPTELKEQGIL